MEGGSQSEVICVFMRVGKDGDRDAAIAFTTVAEEEEGGPLFIYASRAASVRTTSKIGKRRR